MNDISTEFVSRPLGDIFDLNDLVNDLWLAFPKPKDQQLIWAFVEVVHARLCHQANSDCFVCQHRWNREMLALVRGTEAKQLVPAVPSDLPVGIALNRIINQHLRQKHQGLPVTDSPENLWKMCAYNVSALDNAKYSMFNLVRQMDDLIEKLPPDKQSHLRAQGWQPMFQALPDYMMEPCWEVDSSEAG